MILLTEHRTRINDRWILDGSIPCKPPAHAVQHPLIAGGPNQTRFQADFYACVAFDIVTETVYHYPYAYVSEKSLRALACKRLFVILGAPGTLNLLQHKGFDIFSDFVDSNYDSLHCPIQRFHAVVQEIQRLVDTPLDKFKDFYLNNAERFEQNFLQLQTLRRHECRELEARLNQTDRN